MCKSLFNNLYEDEVSHVNLLRHFKHLKCIYFKLYKEI